ncbi:MAG: phosphate acetyltransferase [Dermabacter sp.]|nr:phosphate acetyltransferase [Dermabacter sp.]
MLESVSHSVYVTSPEGRTGKSIIALGLLESLVATSENVGVFRPIIDDRDGTDYAVELLTSHPAVQQEYDEAVGVTYDLVNSNPERAQAEIMQRYQALRDRFSAILVVGSDYEGVSNPAELAFNAAVAANIGASVVLVLRGRGRSAAETATVAQLAFQQFSNNHARPVAVIANRADPKIVPDMRDALAAALPSEVITAVLPESPVVYAPTVNSIKEAVNGTVVQGSPEWLDRVSLDTVVAAMGLPNVLRRLTENSTVIAPGDRNDLLPGLLLAQQSGTFPTLSSIVLTGGYGLPEEISRLTTGVQGDLPIIVTEENTFEAAVKVDAARGRLTASSTQKLDAARRVVAENLPMSRLLATLNVAKSNVVTPMMFQFELIARARGEKKTIVLPEGDEPRIIAAADAILNRGVAHLILLGDETAIRAKASQLGHDITEARIISPHDEALVEEFAEEYARLRAKKGVTIGQARDKVQDVSYFGTMMVHMGYADGMVSGSVNSTAHTIRPSFEIIKTKPGAKIVSSVFLMALEDRVLVYGDCAVNPDPTAEQLADIAEQSAATAQQFGVEPRVAMLSYSTGTSGTGADVDKVREATEIVRASQPELNVEGPIQYDAAVDASVAKTKLPESSVAGRATVFVFPDLNTGNNTYKAVQRSAGAIAIGPVLQGLNKPVNDLSRGALVEDIINTVVITAIQAQGED